MERRLAQIEESVARYLRQLDSADRQKPSEARETKTTRLKEKIAKLKEEVQRLHGLKARMLAVPDQQISLTDPDSRSMATSGRGSGVVGYNVQVAVDTEHHLIIAHEVTNVVERDRAQLAHMATETKATLQATNLDVIADRGYFSTRKCCAPLRTRRTTCSPSSTPSSTASRTSLSSKQTQAAYVSPKKATRWPRSKLIRTRRISLEIRISLPFRRTPFTATGLMFATKPDLVAAVPFLIMALCIVRRAARSCLRLRDERTYADTAFR